MKKRIEVKVVDVIYPDGQAVRRYVTAAGVREVPVDVRNPPPGWVPPPQVKSGPSLTLPDFQMVYQGGHHDVWCDGRTHIWTAGGWAGQWPVEFRRSGKCDCARWKDGGF